MFELKGADHAHFLLSLQGFPDFSIFDNYFFNSVFFVIWVDHTNCVFFFLLLLLFFGFLKEMKGKREKRGRI